MTKRIMYVASSDWHGQRGAWARMPKIQGDSIFGVKQICDFCIDHEVPLLGAGDLHDVDRPDPLTLELIFNHFDRLQKAEVPFYFIRGQHEGKDPTPYFSLHPWPTHLEKKYAGISIPGLGLNVYGLDHCSSDRLQQRLDTISPETDVLICHQVWGDFMGVGAEGVLSQIPHVRTVITGDYHQHLSLSVTGASGQTIQVLSPGAVCLQDITEPRQHYFWVAYDDGSFDAVLLKSRRVWDIVIRTQEDLEVFIASGYRDVIEPQDEVPGEIATNIVYIVCDTGVKDSYRRVVPLLAGKVHLFWKPIKAEEEVVTYDVQQREQAVGRGLVGCLEMVVQRDSPLYPGLLRLLNTKDPKTELVTMEKEFMEDSASPAKPVS